ncbi:hypothetical protein JCM5350_003556 [Sporobolomyces pararoseus]
MSSKTVSHGTSTRIDHLSRLPPELLDDIFDYAYCYSPPPHMLLSRYLLPFHQKQFYRSVKLSSSSQVSKLLASITNQPENGLSVKSLRFNNDHRSWYPSLDALEKLFPYLPNVEMLVIPFGFVEVGARSQRLLSTLSKVTSVWTSPGRDRRDLDVNCFAFLSALPNLCMLNVDYWPSQQWSEGDSDMRTSPQLQNVKYLMIWGRGAGDTSVSKLVELCPSLSTIELWTDYVDSFNPLLHLLTESLETLQLRSRWRTNEPTDFELLRFTDLRYLDLDAGCYSENIHVTLHRLPLLNWINLGGGRISPLDFIPLVSGPTRLVNLTLITLDCDPGTKGKVVQDPTILKDGEVDMNDWRLPEEDNLNVEELKVLMKVADSNEVSMVGELIRGVTEQGFVSRGSKTVEEYWIEKSNRAILSAYNGNDVGFVWLQQVRADAAVAGVTLPILHVDSLDSKRLELVKIDQPERDWFIFSLKNEDR